MSNHSTYVDVCGLGPNQRKFPGQELSARCRSSQTRQHGPSGFGGDCARSGAFLTVSAPFIRTQLTVLEQSVPDPLARSLPSELRRNRNSAFTFPEQCSSQILTVARLQENTSCFVNGLGPYSGACFCQAGG